MPTWIFPSDSSNDARNQETAGPADSGTGAGREGERATLLLS